MIDAPAGDGAGPAHEVAAERRVNVLTAGGTKLTYAIDDELSVGGLIERCQADAGLEGNMAMVYRGRILGNGDRVGTLDTLDEFTIHMFSRQPTAEAALRDVNDLRGFDRLARMGYNRHQIGRLRRRFHQMRIGAVGESAAQRLEAEEEWLPLLVAGDGHIDLPGGRRFVLDAAGAGPAEPGPVVAGGPGEAEVQEPQAVAWWIRALVGFVLGLCFGWYGFIFVIVAYDGAFLLGLGAGALLHVLLSTLVGTNQ